VHRNFAAIFKIKIKMKKIIFPAAIAAIMLLSAFTFINATNWKIADGYAIKFSSKNPSGIFKTMKGDVHFDENNLADSKFDVSVDAASISTGNGMKNKHAKSDKWFDAKKYPTIHFTSNKISKTVNGFEVSGTLEMHGVKKEIMFPFTFTNNIFMGSFNINRTDYNIGSTTGMSANAAIDIKVEISVPVTK
jgi:polyisoprenoid-binding protein YceI